MTDEKGQRPASEKAVSTLAQQQSSGESQSSSQSGKSPSKDVAELVSLIQQLAAAGGIPVNFSQAPPLPVDTTTRLNARDPVTVAFPSCVETLLGLIRTNGVLQKDKDDVTLYFDEYFKFRRHQIFPHFNLVAEQLDEELVKCLGGNSNGSVVKQHEYRSVWPSPCCVCPSCVTLDGDRNFNPIIGVTSSIKRLFIADAVWLFYFEEMGIFRILGVILDDFARRGTLAISNGSLDPGIRDDIAAVILEVMIRETAAGQSSTVRDRDSTYLRCLGWSSETGRRLKQPAQKNTGFSILFHKFIYHALEFYKDRRLAVAIRGAATPAAPPSAATLITLSDTIDVLKKRFETFEYGRNYYNTLNGIVWAIAGMSIIRELRTTLGIPPAFDRPHEYIPAAYDVLVARRPITGSESNRYTLYRECARDARDVLLDIEVLDDQAPGFADPGGELDRWLTQVEGRIEGYRTAYRTLTGIDLGESAHAVVVQQV